MSFCVCLSCFLFFFFFKQKTAYELRISDWSSDVCSSDLLAAAHAALPFIVSWDDHEVENDYAGVHGAATADPAVFLRTRAVAYQAYFKHMPLRPSDLRPDGELRLYRRFGWGDLANVHMLDTRQYRTAHPCETPAERGGQLLRGCGEGKIATPNL